MGGYKILLLLFFEIIEFTIEILSHTFAHPNNKTYCPDPN